MRLDIYWFEFTGLWGLLSYPEGVIGWVNCTQKLDVKNKLKYEEVFRWEVMISAPSIDQYFLLK